MQLQCIYVRKRTYTLLAIQLTNKLCVRYILVNRLCGTFQACFSWLVGHAAAACVHYAVDVYAAPAVVAAAAAPVATVAHGRADGTAGMLLLS